MRLYHFISPKHGIDDLNKKRVKVSLLHKLNDPFELQAGFVKPNRKIRDQFSQFKSNISKKVGIFCCSKNWRNPLLWSHYAEKHTGMAFGFDMPDQKAINVNYSNERPLFQSETLSKNSDHTEFLERLSRTKFKSWEYEEEVRFIYNLNSLIFENGNYFNPFDEEMVLREVIIGCRSSLSKEEVFDALCDYKNITIIWSRMAYKSFRIVRNLKKTYKN